MILETFATNKETEIKKKYLEQGYIKFEIENFGGLEAIKNLILDSASEFVGKKIKSEDNFLNRTHEFIEVKNLNSFRIHIINKIRGTSWFRPTYFSLGRDLIQEIVGNELVMQRSLGLSVQLPDDSSSLLPTHADVWSGDSKFESVLWIPLVDCYRTKAMYIIDPSRDQDFQKNMAEFENLASGEIFNMLESHANFIEIKYGEGLIFNQNLMHGNRVNNEVETRWSLNCRFKNMMAPFGDKKIGEFFEPIVIRPQTQAALDYELPTGFKDEI